MTFTRRQALVWLSVAAASFLHGTALPSKARGVTEDVAKITIAVLGGHPVPENLFGIFFEEINHAGDGGLYAELVNDRSFEGLAYENGFLHSEAEQLRLPHPLPPREPGVDPISWHSPNGTILGLTKLAPLNARNKVALNISATGDEAVIYNDGYWGISVVEGHKYHLKLYLQGNASEAHVSLQSHDGETTYAATSLSKITDSWREQTALLESNGTDGSARLAIRLVGHGYTLLDFVSLFPEENGVAGSTTPFRRDLLELLGALKPGAIRVPGGCFVEGQTLESGFFWGPSIGAPETRPGHWNGPWRYWSTDGLGLFEYMQLAELLSTDAIWVINNGIAHDESVPTARIQALVQDALASLEFVKGPADSKWGRVRASLGREEPWNLDYVAIGNEDCGKPYYVTNYLVFYEAIREVYPGIRLIANCDMGEDAPSDLWDWHWYPDSPGMFGGRFVFDDFSREANGSIYASEYAVFDYGIATSPGGNLQGAIAEAGFMTGIERNSHTVEMAAFAPLLVHANHTNTCPSNLIMYDGARAVQTPSYHVQKLFRIYQGTWYLDTTVDGDDPASNIAASAVCLVAECAYLAIKVVNFREEAQKIDIDFGGRAADDAGLSADVITLTSGSRLDSNTLADPHKVSPKKTSVKYKDIRKLEVPGWSLTVVVLRTMADASTGLEAGVTERLMAEHRLQRTQAVS